MPDFTDLRADLLKLLPEIIIDTTKFIEYGDANMQHPLRSILRIRNIQTPAGFQFCIKYVHFSVEGSGVYLGTDLERVIGFFLARVAQCHQPLKLRTPAGLARRMGKQFDEIEYKVYLSDDQASHDLSLRAVLSRSKSSTA
jgi:hypothetical protein